MSEIKITIPDLGDFESVDVIEILVKAGDTISIEDPLITVESDKAAMDIPSPYNGQIISVEVALGDQVSQGTVVARMTPRNESHKETSVEVKKYEIEPVKQINEYDKSRVPFTEKRTTSQRNDIHASPSVRKYARELGVALESTTASGPKSRILKIDVEARIKYVMSRVKSTGTYHDGELLPEIDFSAFGDIETRPLNKINRLTGENLHRSWSSIPHVFHMENADVTELEDCRKKNNLITQETGSKVTLLAYLVKFTALALQKFPLFNSSLTLEKDSLILKKYINIGVAVNTDRGLLVPAIKDVNKKSVRQLSEEIATLATKARTKKLAPSDMQGAGFTISSLGGAGGKGFTPIINSPEVAILGISPTGIQPIWDGEAFMPRLVLPFTLSYDHRVINGVDGATFSRYLASLLSQKSDALVSYLN